MKKHLLLIGKKSYHSHTSNHLFDGCISWPVFLLNQSLSRFEISCFFKFNSLFTSQPVYNLIPIYLSTWTICWNIQKIIGEYIVVMSSFWFTLYSLHLTLLSQRVFNTLPFPSLSTFFFCKLNPLIYIQSNYVVILFHFLFALYYFISFHHLKRYLILPFPISCSKVFCKLNLFIHIPILFSNKDYSNSR